MRKVLSQVATYLQSYGMGSIGSTLFTYTLPVTPVNAVAVLPNGGGAGKTQAVDVVPVQVLVRRTTVREATEAGDQVYYLVNDKWNVLPTLKGRLEADAPPIPFKDANNFALSSINFRLTTTDVKSPS